MPNLQRASVGVAQLVPATPERPQLACVELLDHGELPRDLGEIWHRGQTHGRLELTLLRSWTRHVRPSPPRRAGETLLTGAASGPRQAEIPGTEIADVLKATDTSANVGGRLLQARSQIVQVSFTMTIRPAATGITTKH